MASNKPPRERCSASPIVRARRVRASETQLDNDLLVVCCPFCGAEHTHGALGIGSPVGTGDGYRAAHCGHGRQYSIVEVRVV